MNYKLEKFWNACFFIRPATLSSMNYKLEKFWNIIRKKDIMLGKANEL